LQYTIKYRIASWQITRTIPFTKKSLNNLEKALRTLSKIWGPNVILIKERQINKNKNLILEKVDFEKLGVINIIERLDYAILTRLFILKPKDQVLNVKILGIISSSLESDDPSLLDKSLQITTSMNGIKKRKFGDLTDDSGNFRVIHSSINFKEQKCKIIINNKITLLLFVSIKGN
jgi:hypothetical protein